VEDGAPPVEVCKKMVAKEVGKVPLTTVETGVPPVEVCKAGGLLIAR
jgi:hypothetical protein